MCPDSFPAQEPQRSGQDPGAVPPPRGSWLIATAVLLLPPLAFPASSEGLATTSLQAVRQESSQEVRRLLRRLDESSPPAGAVAHGSSGTLCEELRARGTNLLDLGHELFQQLELEADRYAPSPPYRWVRFETPSFLLLAPEGSRAATDIAMAAEIAEGTLDRVRTLLAGPPLSGLLTEQFATPVFPSSEKVERVPKIVVTLYPRRPDTASMRGLGATQLGATLVGGDSAKPRFTLRVEVAYFGPLSLSVLTHEIGHVATLLSILDPEPLRTAHDSRSLEKAFSLAFRLPSPFALEAIGDHALYYGGFYEEWGELPAPEALAAELASQGRLPPLEQLVRERRGFRGDLHKAASLAGASLVQFLVEQGERTNLRNWLLASASSATRDFSKLFGPIDEIDRRWREHISGFRSFCPTSDCARVAREPALSTEVEVPSDWCLERVDQAAGGAAAAWLVRSCGALEAYRSSAPRQDCGVIWMQTKDSLQVAENRCRDQTGELQDDGCWEGPPFGPEEFERERRESGLGGSNGGTLRESGSTLALDPPSWLTVGGRAWRPSRSPKTRRRSSSSRS